MKLQVDLHLKAEVDGIRGGVEHQDERVALSCNFVSVEIRERLAHGRIVQRQAVAHQTLVVRPQLRRTLNVSHNNNHVLGRGASLLHKVRIR